MDDAIVHLSFFPRVASAFGSGSIPEASLNRVYQCGVCCEHETTQDVDQNSAFAAPPPPSCVAPAQFGCIACRRLYCHDHAMAVSKDCQISGKPNSSHHLISINEMHWFLENSTASSSTTSPAVCSEHGIVFNRYDKICHKFLCKECMWAHATHANCSLHDAVHVIFERTMKQYSSALERGCEELERYMQSLNQTLAKAAQETSSAFSGGVAEKKEEESSTTSSPPALLRNHEDYVAPLRVVKDAILTKHNRIFEALSLYPSLDIAMAANLGERLRQLLASLAGAVERAQLKLHPTAATAFNTLLRYGVGDYQQRVVQEVSTIIPASPSSSDTDTSSSFSSCSSSSSASLLSDLPVTYYLHYILDLLTIIEKSQLPFKISQSQLPPFVRSVNTETLTDSSKKSSLKCRIGDAVDQAFFTISSTSPSPSSTTSSTSTSSSSSSPLTSSTATTEASSSSTTTFDTSRVVRRLHNINKPDEVTGLTQLLQELKTADIRIEALLHEFAKTKKTVQALKLEQKQIEGKELPDLQQQEKQAKVKRNQLRKRLGYEDDVEGDVDRQHQHQQQQHQHQEGQDSHDEASLEGESKMTASSLSSSSSSPVTSSLFGGNLKKSDEQLAIDELTSLVALLESRASQLATIGKDAGLNVEAVMFPMSSLSPDENLSS